MNIEIVVTEGDHRIMRDVVTIAGFNEIQNLKIPWITYAAKYNLILKNNAEWTHLGLKYTATILKGG